MARLRTLPKAANEIREKDPETCVSLCVLRRWVKEGKIPCVKTGTHPLVDMDTVERYMEGATRVNC